MPTRIFSLEFEIMTNPMRQDNQTLKEWVRAAGGGSSAPANAGRVGHCRIPKRKSSEKALGLFLFRNTEVKPFNANGTWLGE